MTEQEAFERIKDELPFESGVINEALSIVEQACEKQIPKKPVMGLQFVDKSEEWHKQHGISWQVYRCPACYWLTGISTITKEPYRPNYCKHCGQAIMWEESE